MASKRKQKPERRSYTAEEKERVAQEAERDGVVVVALRHGIAKSSVCVWRKAYLASKASAGTRAGRSAGTGEPRADKVEDGAGKTPSADVQGAPSTSAGGKGRKRVAKVYSPSQRAEVVEYAAEHGATQAQRRFGVSRYSVYQWQMRVQRAAEGKGDDPTSGPPATQIEEQRDREILGVWRKHPGLGPSQVRNQLRRAGVKVSVHTVRRVMQEAGYRPPKVERKAHDQRYEAVRPNHLWHADFLHRYINRASTFTLIFIDDCSRFVVGHGVDSAERADLVIDAFEQAVERHGRPESVMTDKGSAFWSWRGISRFTALLTELGIDHIQAEHKEHNGKVEVFNANIQKELFDRQRFYDLDEMKRRLATHLHWYNHARTHHALGGLLVPADRYYGRQAEVMARIEAGEGRELGDALELRDRQLDLFRILSKDGVPEVWLLGKKLLELGK